MNPHPLLRSAPFALLFASPALGLPPDEERLHKLFQDRYEWEMSEFPESAMRRGDYRHADRLTDVSLAAIERRHEETLKHHMRLRFIDVGSIAEADVVNYELFELRLLHQIEGHRFRMFLAPVGQRFGPHQTIPQMADQVRFASTEDYVNYLKRLDQVPTHLADTIELMRLGLQEQRTPPKVSLLGVPQQLDALLDGGLDELARPFEAMPGHMADQTRQNLKRHFEEETMPRVREAMVAFRRFFVEEYLPHCRESIAATTLPDGEAYYTHQLRRMTTTDMTAEAIHELGLKEVARIRSEMMSIIRASDFLERHPAKAELDEDALFSAFIEYLRTDSRFYHDSEEQLLAAYRDICKRVDAWLPRFFGVLPRLPYGVKKIPDFMAPQQTTAYYSHGSLENGEPGFFYANAYALDQRPTYEMVALAMHEAVPGHHLQSALAQELESVPEFRKHGWFTAFGEGWALYSERLGIEMGLYEDPYDDFGRLLYEMWRACRLVVDPGMHALGWSREEAVQFLRDNTALSELNIQNEIDRYIAWPGQACAYKIGELKIRHLRREAEDTLGSQFDLRAFHDVVLGAGSVPLTVLERRVNDWVREVRFGGIVYD